MIGTPISAMLYLLVDGEEYEDDYLRVADDDFRVIGGGVVYKDENMEQEVCSYETYFRLWVKQQKNATLIIAEPKENLEELQKILKKLNAKVVQK